MRLIKIAITVAFIIGLYACNSSNSQFKPAQTGPSQLKIAIDSSVNFYIDSISLSGIQSTASVYRQYDSSLNDLVYVFDSVENGRGKLTLVSLLGRTYNREINISSDTIIAIKANELNNFTRASAKSLPSLVPKEGDSLVVGYSVSGCFSFFKETIIVTKAGESYNVSFNAAGISSDDNQPKFFAKTFGPSFANNLDSFYTDCKTLVKQNPSCFSTSSVEVLLRIRNTVYKLPDAACSAWNGYDRLVKAIGLPWEKNG